ncbi:MAG: galactose-1-phosphate uridylyltransferase [Actinobacteria bacterium]|nr:galactose-1-phosphate uridylyltransferase [Actinomycetota bacterium]
MVVIRQDLATRDWTIFSTERSKRPKDFRHEEGKLGSKGKCKDEYVESCPFCKGNEHMTPRELFSIREDGEWLVRVVLNKYPALEIKNFCGPVTRHIKGPYLSMDGIGSHEVIIESPRHNDDLATMDRRNLENVLLTYWHRSVDLSKNEDYQLIIIFRNHGIEAGTSLEHPHSQLIATPFVPGYVRNKLYESQRYFDNFGRCPYCDMIDYELKDRERLVYEDEKYVAFTPYASVVPYNILVLPKKHQANFVEASEEEIRDLASVFKVVLAKLYYLLDNPDYNYVIDSSPTDKSGERHYHWHIEILPRLTTRAGFEIGSGVTINFIFPEDCARHLREVKV